MNDSCRRVIRVARWLLLLAPVWPTQSSATPIHTLPGVQYVVFWEATDGTTIHKFGAHSTQITNRLDDPLASGSHDFRGAHTEYYDVFCSEPDGTFNPDGECITVECVTQYEAPYGGGLNICGIALDFTNGVRKYATAVRSFTAMGNNALPETVDYAVDGNLATCTAMGNTVGTSQRLRVTVGFETPQPPVGSENLVAHYRLDGNALDSSGNGYHGVITGAVPAADLSGRDEGAFSFDGDDSISIPVPLLQQLTLSAWFKLPAAGNLPDDAVTIVGDAGCYKIYLLSDLTLMGNTKAGSSLLGQWTGGPFATNLVQRGVWHHTAWTRGLDGRQALYLDGQLVAQGTYNAGTIQEGFGDYIGMDRWHLGLRYHFYGSIDDVRMYNRPLTGEEVGLLWNETPSWEQPPVLPSLHYEFDQDIGTNVVDSASEKHDGTAF